MQQCGFTANLIWFFELKEWSITENYPIRNIYFRTKIRANRYA